VLIFCKTNLDFTVNGAFDPFNKTGIELRRRTHNSCISTSFEDTGVRAYKGQAANLISTQIY
jgi:hypothetical protein